MSAKKLQKSICQTTESVKAYYTLVQHRYKGGNYLLWLDKIGYAEEKTYIRALIKVLKQL